MVVIFFAFLRNLNFLTGPWISSLQDINGERWTSWDVTTVPGDQGPRGQEERLCSVLTPRGLVE
jgi:hypothetical protein